MGQLLVFASDDETNSFKFLRFIITRFSGQPDSMRSTTNPDAGWKALGSGAIGLSGTFTLDIAYA
jgi:hypothetical protein